MALRAHGREEGQDGGFRHDPVSEGATVLLCEAPDEARGIDRRALCAAQKRGVAPENGTVNEAGIRDPAAGGEMADLMRDEQRRKIIEEPGKAAATSPPLTTQPSNGPSCAIAARSMPESATARRVAAEAGRAARSP